MMNSDVVKPNIFGRFVSYTVFGLLALLLVGSAIWLVFKISLLAGLIVVVVLVVGGYLGITQVFSEVVSDFGGFLGGDLFMNSIALRLMPEQVNTSWFLKLLFYVDTSRPLTEDKDETL